MTFYTFNNQVQCNGFYSVFPPLYKVTENNEFEGSAHKQNDIKFIRKSNQAFLTY